MTHRAQKWKTVKVFQTNLKQLCDKALTLSSMLRFWRKVCNIPFDIRGNHFLVHGSEKGFTSVSCIYLSCSICCHNNCNTHTFSITFLHCDSCLSNILRYLLSDPNLCALFPLRVCARCVIWEHYHFAFFFVVKVVIIVFLRSEIFDVCICVF